MDERTEPSADDQAIGRRARRIRKRRGLSLDAAAGLAGISKQYLSRLETGQRRFIRRGLLEDLAQALSCSVSDLTGQPYQPPDQDGADALGVLPGVRLALNDYGPDDVPDVTPRSLDELVAWAERANEDIDQAHFSLVGRDAGERITELQAHALTAKAPDSGRAFAALVTGCMVAGAVAKNIGNIDLAVTAARRGYDSALRQDDPGLLGFARWYWALGLMRLAARRRASVALTRGIDELSRVAHLGSDHTLAAEMAGLMHLTSAQTAARERRGQDARAHLDEADRIATRVGERNGMRQHFGPTNVAGWRLAVGIELSEGGRAYAEITGSGFDVSVLGSRERSCSLHLDLTRALVQDGPRRDAEALRHLDTADRIAPQRVRNDPIARDLVLDLDRRAQRRVWELDSLKRRLGVA